MAAVPPVTSLFPWSRWRPRVSLTPGSGFPRGPFIVASSTRASFFRTPPVPRAVPPRRLAVGQGEVRTRGRGDRRAAVPGPGVRHRHRQGRAVCDDPDAVGEQPGTAWRLDPHLRHHPSGGPALAGMQARGRGAPRWTGATYDLLEV